MFRYNGHMLYCLMIYLYNAILQRHWWHGVYFESSNSLVLCFIPRVLNKDQRVFLNRHCDGVAHCHGTLSLCKNITGLSKELICQGISCADCRTFF